MSIRGIRGATTVTNNDKGEILNETRELLEKIIERNKLKIEDIASIWFSTTRDLDAVYPAVAARELGITNAALMCTNEMYVPGSLEKCIRVMFHVNSDLMQDEIKHAYLKGAAVLRPDLTQ